MICTLIIGISPHSRLFTPHPPCILPSMTLTYIWRGGDFPHPGIIRLQYRQSATVYNSTIKVRHPGALT